MGLDIRRSMSCGYLDNSGTGAATVNTLLAVKRAASGASSVHPTLSKPLRPMSIPRNSAAMPMALCTGGATAQVLSRGVYTEGPTTSSMGVLFAEYAQHRVMCWRGQVAQPLWNETHSGPAGLASLPNGDILVACYDSHQVVRLRPEAKAVKEVARYHIPRPNDFCVDADGGAYVTSSGEFYAGAPVDGAIYYMAPNKPPRRVAQGIYYSNGLGLSPDGRYLYVSEHLKNRVCRYLLRSPGVLDNHLELFADLSLSGPPHPASQDARLLGPDGLHVDTDGSLWVGQFAGARLLHIDSAGQHLCTVQWVAPYINITNVHRLDNERLLVTANTDDQRGVVVLLHHPCWSEATHVRCQIL